MMWSTIIIAICFACYLFKDKLFRPLNFPPGPTPLPIVGNLFSIWSMKKKLKFHHLVWKSWILRYGELLGIRLGSVNVVIVSGKDLIKEVSTNDSFSGRPDGLFFTTRAFGKKIGLVFNDGDSWVIIKRSIMKSMKTHGYGTRLVEDLIQTECEELVKLRLSDANQPITVDHMFDISITNILWRIVAGKRYNLNDEHLTRLCHLIRRAFQVVGMTGGAMNSFPFLRHVIPGPIGYTELVNIHNEMYGFLKKTLKEHKQTIDYKNPRDVIDSLLIDMDYKNNKVTDEEILVICLDLFEAGMETVGNTMVFMMLYIVIDEKVQRKLQEEIDFVIGTDRVPLVGDRSRMVYTEAVLMETLRFSSVAAVGIPHKALSDTKLRNHIIPKDTIILFAVHHLHNCSRWGDPENFRPERFITKDGNLIQDEWIMPFGTGKRKCIGESLARSEMFMFLTHLLQRFNLKLPPGDPEPSMEPMFDGVTLAAPSFRIIFEPRF